ncbi:hypothetical protein P4O66_017487, partial [Electrophorus voltai]
QRDMYKSLCTAEEEEEEGHVTAHIKHAADLFGDLSSNKYFTVYADVCMNDSYRQILNRNAVRTRCPFKNYKGLSVCTRPRPFVGRV